VIGVTSGAGGGGRGGGAAGGGGSMHEISELFKSSVTLQDSGSYRCYSIGRLVDTVQVKVIKCK